MSYPNHCKRWLYIFKSLLSSVTSVLLIASRWYCQRLNDENICRIDLEYCIEIQFSYFIIHYPIFIYPWHRNDCHSLDLVYFCDKRIVRKGSHRNRTTYFDYHIVTYADVWLHFISCWCHTRVGSMPQGFALLSGNWQFHHHT